MTTGGSTPATDAMVQAALGNNLKLPPETPTQTVIGGPLAPQTPAPVAAPVVKPPPVNVSGAAVTADAAVVELPTFDAAEPPKAEEPVKVEAPDEDADLPNQPSAENFKKFRTVIKETRQEKKALEEKLAEAVARAERYERGEVVPEIIQAKDQKIAELEPLAKIVNLKLSPEYQQKFVEPMIELKGKLSTLAKDYGIPPEILEQAVGLESRAEINRFLTEHVRLDELGALEAKNIINEMHRLGEESIEAEKEPAQAMESLRAQSIERERLAIAERMTVFENTSKEAWNRALAKTAQEKAYPELILRPGDTEHNKIVEQNQYLASVQYGVVVKKLAAGGLKQLDPDLAYGLARSIQLAIAGAKALEAKDKAERRNEQLIKNTQRITPYIRPSIGGNNGSAHSNKASPNAGPTDPRAAGVIAAQRAGTAFK